ncbi:MAG: T9SS type A sorting domain-containing protein [Sphingobacteriales bacterium]
MDINGKLVYTGGGATDKNYRFGDKFSPGLYFVEVIQSGKRSTIKIIKQ